MKQISLISLSLISILVTGCNKESEATPDITPGTRTIEFKGKPDAKYVGIWKLKNADIRYKMESDGKYKYYGTVSSPGGVQKIDASGKWAVEGRTFYVTSDKDGQVSDYDVTLEGKVLTLTSKGMRKVKSTYDKE